MDDLALGESGKLCCVNCPRFSLRNLFEVVTHLEGFSIRFFIIFVVSF